MLSISALYSKYIIILHNCRSRSFLQAEEQEKERDFLLMSPIDLRLRGTSEFHHLLSQMGVRPIQSVSGILLYEIEA